MRMRGQKAIFNYKDTWNMNDTLRPIIGAGIAKFLEVKSAKDELYGIPSSVFSNNNIADENEASKIWNEILEKMNYAFNQPEPDMNDYDFDYNEITSTLVNDEKFGEVYAMDPITVTNQSEHQRFKNDSDEWEKRCQEGYELFGKYFKNLWW